MTIRSASPPPDYPALLERAQRALRRDPELRAARACTPTHDGCVPDDGIGRYPRTRAEDGTWIGTGARVGSDVVIARGARVAPDAVVRDAAVVRRRAGSGRSEFGIAA